MSVITLIIDDDPLMRLIHQILLDKNQIADHPVILTNGQEAIDYLLKSYDIDQEYLILLDIHMPVMNGWGFLQEINKAFKGNNLHVFVVSSSVQVEAQKTAKCFPHVVDFLEKPLKIESLEIIKAYLESLTSSLPKKTVESPAGW